MVIEVLAIGDDGAILAIGPTVVQAQAAHDLIFEATGKRVRVVNMASLRPFDRAAVEDAARTGFVLTVEDHHPDTGLGGLATMVIADAGIATTIQRAGIDQWSMSGKPADIFAAYRIDATGIAERVITALR